MEEPKSNSENQTQMTAFQADGEMWCCVPPQCSNLSRTPFQDILRVAEHASRIRPTRFQRDRFLRFSPPRLLADGRSPPRLIDEIEHEGSVALPQCRVRFTSGCPTKAPYLPKSGVGPRDTPTGYVRRTPSTRQRKCCSVLEFSQQKCGASQPAWGGTNARIAP
jgi:hypothetical protein